jgi:putative hydrolase of the HAD superfamily
VDAVVLSSELGVAKPAPEVFETIAARLSVPAGRCWYVGDGGSDELAGARRAGMTPVWLRDPGAADAFVHGFAPADERTVTIPALDALLPLLGLSDREDLDTRPRMPE